ncbi:hypothetical protein GJAV_G00249670 [Gymnothorax javanicus]|nr:hypothetical protein GJAV_G00249670 [Gymnothorax javanicus]
MWLWQRPGFEQQLLGGLQRQQKRGLFCDMLLQADGISVPAHSCVLAALSPALAQVLCSGPAPPHGQRRLLELQGVRAEPLLRLVGFLYSGQLQGQRPAEREELTLAAVHLGIEGLLGECGGEEGERRAEGEENRGEREDMLTAEGPTQTDNPQAPPPAVRTSSSLPVLGRLTPPRPPVSPTPCPAVPLEGSDNYFTLSSSAAPGLAGISQIRSASAAGSAQAALTAALSDDVTTAPLPAVLTVPAQALGSVAASLAGSSPANPAILLKRGGGATLNGAIRARQNFCGDGTDQGGTCFLGPRAVRGGRTRKMRHGRMKSRGGGARPQDQRLSIKIRLKRRCKGELWEIVSVLEEGVACVPRVGSSIGRGRSLRHRQNLPTLSRITRSKRLRQQWPSRGAVLPQRIHGTRPLPLPPSAPPLPDDSDEQIEKLLNDIMMGLDMLETGAGSQGDGGSLDLAGRGSFPCPQRPDLNDSATRPENQAQCGVLSGPPPIKHQSKCTCSQETALPRVPQQASEELCILDHFLRSRGGQVGGVLEGAAHGRCVGGGDVSTGDAQRKNCDPQLSVTVATSAISQGSSDLAAQARAAAVRLGQASSPWRELRIPEFLSPPPPISPGLKELQLPHCLSPLSPKKNASNSAPPGPSPSSLPPQALVLTTSAPLLPVVAQPLSSPLPSVLAPPPSDLPHSVTPPLAQHLLGPPHSYPPPAALATPPPAPPPPATSPSAPPLLATPPIPPWLCPFPVPLNSLSSPLPDGLQLPSCHCPTRSRRGQSSCLKRDGEMGGAGGEEEEGGTQKTVTRQPVDGGRKQKRRRVVKEREEEVGGKRARPTLTCRNVRRSGIYGVGRGKGVARTPRSARDRPLQHFEAALAKPFTCADTVHSANVCTKKTRSTTLTRRNTNVCTQSTTLDGRNANICTQKTQGTSRNGRDANFNAQKTQSSSLDMCNANICAQNTQGLMVAGCNANVSTQKAQSLALDEPNANVNTQKTQSSTLAGSNASIDTQKIRSTTLDRLKAKVCTQKTQSSSLDMCNANICAQNTQGLTVAGCNANVSTQKTQSLALDGPNANINAQKTQSIALDGLNANVNTQKTQGSTLAVRDANVHTQKTQSATLAGLNANVNAQKTQSIALDGLKANVNTQKTQSSTLAGSNASIDTQKIRSTTLDRLKAKVCTQKTQGSTLAERDANIHTQKTQSMTFTGLNANVHTQKTQSSTLAGSNASMDAQKIRSRTLNRLKAKVCTQKTQGSTLAVRDANVHTQKTQSATLAGLNANVCTQRTQDAAVCSENTRHSNRSAGRLRRRCICTEDVKRTMLCADRLKRSAVCGSLAQTRGVCVDKEGAGQQEGVCLREEKPTLSRAGVRLAAAACARSKRPVKQSRGRPPMRRSVPKNEGQTSVLDWLESSGRASTLAPTESRGEASFVAPTGCGEQASTVAPAGSDQPAAISPSAGPVGLGCILAPASSCEETGERRRAPPKAKRMSVPGSQEPLQRTLRSRACRLGESLLPSTGCDTQAEEGRKEGTREKEGDLKNVAERMGEMMGGAEMVQLGTVVLDGVTETEGRREEGVKRMGAAEGVENTGIGRKEQRKTDGGKAENSEENVAMELGEKEQEGGATDDLAPPTAVGAEDQAMHTVDMEEDQVTPKNGQVTEQAMPTPQLMRAADASRHSKSICDVITTDSSVVQGEREEPDVTGEEERTEGSAAERRDGRREEGGDTGQTDTRALASGEELVDVVMEDTATTEQVISEQRELCGEGSHAGSESREPKTSLIRKQSDPCTESAKSATGSLEQDEEEVEVDVLGCTSPAYLAIDLMLENMGAGLNDRGADLTARSSCLL